MQNIQLWNFGIPLRNSVLTGLEARVYAAFLTARMRNLFNHFQAGANRLTIRLNRLLGRIDELARWEQQTRWDIEPAGTTNPLGELKC